MSRFLAEFLNSFDEIHYFLAGNSTGFILGFLLAVVIFVKVIIPAIKKRSN